MSARYKFSSAASRDWYSIMDYTFENFGHRQVEKYSKSLSNCIQELVNADIFAIRFERNYLEKRFVSIECEKHYVVAKRLEDQSLTILAILHERMDVINRVKDRL